MVHPATEFTNFTKIKATMPIVSGHKGPIQDCDFSPFHENCLATASTDGSVKIWMVPEGGYKENVN